MSAITRTHMQGMIQTMGAPETGLPPMPPLTMTRNFVWVFAVCAVLLSVIPLLAGVVAGAVLK